MSNQTNPSRAQRKVEIAEEIYNGLPKMQPPSHINGDVEVGMKLQRALCIKIISDGLVKYASQVQTPTISDEDLKQYFDNKFDAYADMSDVDDSSHEVPTMTKQCFVKTVREIQRDTEKRLSQIDTALRLSNAATQNKNQPSQSFD